MIRDKHLGCVLTLALVWGLLTATSGSAGETQQAPQAALQGKGAPSVAQRMLEPKAIEIIKAACSRLAAARTMSFTAVVTYENPSIFGAPLAYTTKSEVILQRPDKLRVITSGDGPVSEFYYNGKTMTAFAPGENLVAVAEAPPTIDAALQAANESAAIYFPFTDVIVADPYKDIADGLIHAFYIGQSRVVGGTTTDMVAYASNEVFVQAWIGVEDKLPRMLRAVYSADPAELRHQLELSNWQLDFAVSGDAFATTRAGSAKPIAFAHPNALRPEGVKDPAHAQPANSK